MNTTETNPIVVRNGQYYRQSDPSYMQGCDTEWELRYYEWEMESMEYITDMGQEPSSWWWYRGQTFKALHWVEMNPALMVPVCALLGLGLGIALYLAF